MRSNVMNLKLRSSERRAQAQKAERTQHFRLSPVSHSRDAVAQIASGVRRPRFVTQGRAEQINGVSRDPLLDSPCMIHMRVRSCLSTCHFDATSVVSHFDATSVVSTPSPRLERALRPTTPRLDESGIVPRECS